MNILKTRRFWSSLDLSFFEVISCRALFEYLVSRSSEKAIAIFEEALNKLSASSYEHEILLTELVRFINSLENLHDMDRTIQMPSTNTINRVYGSAKEIYPHNTLFRWVINFTFHVYLLMLGVCFSTLKENSVDMDNSLMKEWKKMNMLKSIFKWLEIR